MAYKKARKGYRRYIPTGKQIAQGVRIGGGVASAAYTALKIAKGLKAMSNAEIKYVDNSATAVYSTTPSVNYVSGVAQGDTASQREGISIKSIAFVITGTASIGAASTVPTCLRYVLVMDRQNSGGTPAFTDVFTAGSVDALRKIETSKRFKIVCDRKVCFSPNGNEKQHIDIYKKWSAHLEYQAATNAVADSYSNQFFFMLVSDQATNAPGFNWTVRMRYVDN